MITNAQAAGLFREMARRLDQAGDNPFAGAYLILPPGDEAKPLDHIGSASVPHVAAFWNLVSGMLDLTIAEIKEAAEQNKRRMGLR